ncbi:hypothetical protein ACJX0J_038640, partial [Zea mays]
QYLMGNSVIVRFTFICHPVGKVAYQNKNMILGRFIVHAKVFLRSNPILHK